MIHYSEGDRENEIRIAQRFCDKFGGVFTKNEGLTDFYDVLWESVNIPEWKYYLEIKKRHFKSTDFPDIAITEDKIIRARNGKYKMMIVVEWNDKIGCINFRAVL